MKRIVFDLDDTISFTKKRDWKNAKPNIQLIEKINNLYNSGWQIDIYTARGSLSCSTREEAAKKYRKGIEEWLEKHKVKYHTLSFNKPLATYYVDDKALTPEEFLDLNLEQLKGGLSGSDIYTDGTLVFKEDHNRIEVNKWFEKAESYGFKVPKVERIIGNTLIMDYISNDETYFQNNPYKIIGEILTVLDSFKNLSPYSTLSFDTYIQNIQKHLENISEINTNSIIHRLKEFPIEFTFGHGDFGVTNLLFSNDGMYMIDPIPYRFSNYQLDAAKFLASLIINHYDFEIYNIVYKQLITFLGINDYQLKTLIASELIRVVKYSPEKEFIIYNISNVLK